MPGFFKKVLIFLGLTEEEEKEEEFIEQEDEKSKKRFVREPSVKYIGKNKGEYIKKVGRSEVLAHAKVHIIEPQSFGDAQTMGNKFKDDIPVIINLQRVEQELAKRIIDFASGLTFGLDGGIQRVADRVFLITPHNVEVSAEEKVKLQERGLFNQF